MSRPRKPNTGQAPITRNSTPEMKLTPPMPSMSTRKPVEPSERCGVMIAEKMVGSGTAALSRLMVLTIREKMARKTTGQRIKAAREGKAAQVKSGTAQAKADDKAAHGELPQWSTAEIDEAFRRFAAANPAPRGELEHINPFTLLVAVVLSAQATDAGVNKATPALFALADTPEKMAALGEAKVRDPIKTIGLFRNKAKNVVELSRRLVAEHGGQVPRSRE